MAKYGKIWQNMAKYGNVRQNILASAMNGGFLAICCGAVLSAPNAYKSAAGWNNKVVF
jgi:hypothetical protein